MKRLLSAAIAGALLCPVFAQVQIEFVWSGGGASGSVELAANWEGNQAPTGTGNEDLVFGSFTGPQVNVTLPPTAAFHDLTFNGTSALTLTFSATNNENATLVMNGDLMVAANYDLLFESTLAVDLGDGSHTVAVGSDAELRVDGPVGGLTATSALVKDGSGVLRLHGANTYAGGTTVRAGTLTLDGAGNGVGDGTLQHPTKDLVVGSDLATSAFLNLVNGAEITDAIGTIGQLAGTNGSVTLGGASTWTNTTYLYVGDAGDGELMISGLSFVTSPNISIGNNSGGVGTVTVDGLGNTLSATNTLYVGSAGEGSLDVFAGGTVTSGTGVIGNNPGGFGDAWVNGFSGATPSTWSNTGALIVGGSSSGDLWISDGGLVTNTEGWIGLNSEAVGSVKVSGGGVWTNSSFLVVGKYGTGTLEILNGGSVTNLDGHIGHLGGSFGAVIVGADSYWDITGVLRVGDGGYGSLTVEAGGNVHNTGDAIIGDDVGITGVASVTGLSGGSEPVPSSWYSDGLFIVGASGTGTVSIADSGLLFSGPASVGLNTPGVGSMSIGAFSTWYVETSLRIGVAGEGIVLLEGGGNLVVENGAGMITLGQDATGSGSLVLAPGAGGVSAAGVTTGNGAGQVQFSAETSDTAPYYFTSNGSSSGTPVPITGGTLVLHTLGHTVLTADSTYDGGTFITGGTLIASGSTTLVNPLGLGPVTVASGGTLATSGLTVIDNVIDLQSGGRLAGDGVIVEAVVQNGGIVAPGFSNNRIAELSFEELTLGPGGWLEVDVSFNDGLWDHDRVNVTSSETLTISALPNSPFTIKLVSLTGAAVSGPLAGQLTLGEPYELTLINAQSVSGSFSLGANLLIDTSEFATDFDSYVFGLTEVEGVFTLTFTPVPEPSTYALMALGLTIVAAAGRRRVRRG